MPVDQGSGEVDDESLSERITEVSDAVHGAMGVTDSRVAFEYERTSADSCALELGLERGLGPGQAWYARRAYALGPGTYDYDALLEAAAAHFRSDGWETQTYRRSVSLRALTARKGDVGVVVTVPPVNVTVSAGPCGPSSSRVSHAFRPDPG